MATLITALDLENAKKALTLARELSPVSDWFKIGLELFVAAGPNLIREMKDRGHKIFLDLKFYDIPNTAAHAVASAARLGVDMLTIHCQGGQRMCAAARDAVHKFTRPPLLFGVTVLTSFAEGEMPGIKASAGEFALELAQDAENWGLDGVVCSAREARAIKKAAAGLSLLCPGIRPALADAGDQRRTMSPAEAVAAGADFLVVGRPILASPDPGEAAAAILAEMRAAEAVI